MSEIIGNDPKGNPYDVPLDQDKLISGKRFKRGFRSGLRHFFQSTAIGAPTFGALMAMTATPEMRESAVQAISQLTPEHVGIVAVAATSVEAALATGIGSATGVIDAFRPTSKIFKKYLETDWFRDIASGYRGIANFDYKQAAIDTIDVTKKIAKDTKDISYAILRPELSQSVLDRKKDLVALATATSTISGGAMVATCWMYASMDRAAEWIGLGATTTPAIIDSISQHPLETVATSAAVGLVGSSYALIAGRRPNTKAP